MHHKIQTSHSAKQDPAEDNVHYMNTNPVKLIEMHEL